MKPLKTLLTAILCFYITGNAFGQTKKLIIHPVIGCSINKENNLKYPIIPAHPNFDSAAFYRTAEGKIFATAYLNESGKSKEVTIYFSSINIRDYILRIEYPDDNMADISAQKTGIFFDSTECCYYAKLKSGSLGFLPHITKDYKSSNKDKYLIGFGVSVDYSAPDFSSINDLLSSVENELANNGYNISHANINTNVNMFLNFILNLKIYGPIWTNFDAGFALSPDIDAWQVSGFLNYRHKIKKIEWLEPYAGIGFGIFNYRLTVKYPEIIDNIAFHGHKAGLMFLAGTDLFLTNTSAITRAALHRTMASEPGNE